MRDTSQALRATTVEALFTQICRATPGEARDLSMLLTPTERADMALFCYVRTHTREQGRAIAAACTTNEMVRTGGHAGAALYAQAEGKGDTWGASAMTTRKLITLAG